MIKKKTIKDRILIDIFNIWDFEENGLVKARDELKKMYLKEYNQLTDIEEKRLILHNLTVAEIELGLKDQIKVEDMESVKLYTEVLKNDMDKVEGYKDGENACLYTRVLINYIESHKRNLSKEELIKYYEYCYKVYEEFDDKNENGYLSKLVMKFNLNLAIENFNVVLEVLEDMLHSDNTQYRVKFDELSKEVEIVNKLLYKRVLLLKQKQKLQII